MNKIEITDRIYDTLFKNKQHPQFPVNDTKEQFVSSNNSAIGFDIDNKRYLIKVFETIKEDIND